MRHIRFPLVLLAAGVVAVLALGGSPAESAFPGVNGKIAFVTDRVSFTNWEVYVMDADGGSPTNLTINLAVDGDPAWSRDGSKIAFDSNRHQAKGEIYVMDASPGSPATRLTNNTAYDIEPAWSPDGSKIAFVSNRHGNDEIYVMDASPGSPATRLTNNTATDGEPAWSPDGKKIAYSTNRDGGNWEVYVMDAADGGNKKNLTNNGAVDSSPDWSPYGTQIVFQREIYGNVEIFVMDADGSDQTNLTEHTAKDYVPAWSPDGTKIAYASWRDGNSEIYVMNPDGSNPQNRSNNPAFDTSPDWQPAGTITGTIPPGDDQRTSLDGLTLKCLGNTGGGDATLSKSEGGPAPAPPYFRLLPNQNGQKVYYEITNTVSCHDPNTGKPAKWKVCFAYDPTLSEQEVQDLKLFKLVGPSYDINSWEELTNQTLEEVGGVKYICGEVDSFSWFIMAGPTPVGGIVEIGADAHSPAEASGSSSAGDYGLPIAAVALAAGGIALAASGWYVRRRLR